MRNAMWVGGGITGMGGIPMLGTGARGLTTLIKGIFRNNEQGFAYDPNDLTTLFQDAAGTIPVTAAGQPVGLMKDKSGRNNHAYQTTSASRPRLQRNATTGAYYLAFDGADDFLVTNSINFAVTDKVSLFVGVRKLSATSGLIVELGNDTTNNKFFLLNEYRFLARGNVVYASNQRAEKLVNIVPTDAVVSAMGNVQASLNTIRINGEQGINSTTPLGSGVFINAPIYIGRRGGTSLPFNGHIYSLIGIGRLTTDAETLALEKAIAKNTGVTLNV